jgi:hypothetical protein
MITVKRRGCSYLITCCLVAVLCTGGSAFSLAWAQSEYPVEAPPPPEAAAPLPPQAPEAPAPLSNDELDDLIAPIALYPDALVAQILAGSTYPTEVVEAARWQSANPGLSGDSLAEAVDSQNWDPSVKALTQFPSVLANMNNNLSWTSALGQAYYYQPEDVLNAVQVMRRRALAARTLVNTRQQRYYDQSGMVMIEPADPNEVYVPAYNPGDIYGTPVAVYPGYSAPGYSTGEMVGAGALAFGAGVAVGALASQAWGWHGWNTDWHQRHVTYHNTTYVSNTNTFAPPGTYGGTYGGQGSRGGNFNRKGGNNRQGGLNAPVPGRPSGGSRGGSELGAPPNGARASGGPRQMGGPVAVRPGPGAGAGYKAGAPANRPPNVNPQVAGGGPRQMGAPVPGRPPGGSRSGPEPGALANRPANANPQVAIRGPGHMGASVGAPPAPAARPAPRPNPLIAPSARNNPRPPVSQPNPYRGFAKAPASGLNKTAFARIAPGSEAVAASARGRASVGRAPAPPLRPAPQVHAVAAPRPAPQVHAAAAPARPAAPAARPAAPATHKH